MIFAKDVLIEGLPCEIRIYIDGGEIKIQVFEDGRPISKCVGEDIKSELLSELSKIVFKYCEDMMDTLKESINSK